MGYRQGDIVEFTIDGGKGHEQIGARPCVVVSNDNFNTLTGFTMIVPATSTVKDYPTRVHTTDDCYLKGDILTDQIRSLDLKARKAVYKGHLDEKTLSEVINLVRLSF